MTDKAKSLFTPSKLGSVEYGFCLSVDTFDRYLFQLIALLKPDFSCSNIFTLYQVNKVTTGT